MSSKSTTAPAGTHGFAASASEPQRGCRAARCDKTDNQWRVTRQQDDVAPGTSGVVLLLPCFDRTQAIFPWPLGSIGMPCTDRVVPFSASMKCQQRRAVVLQMCHRMREIARNGAAGIACVVLCALVPAAETLAAEWEVSQLDNLVIASTPGTVTHGDRQQFVFQKEDCEKASHIFTAYTTQTADFRALDGRVLAIELNGERTEAKLIFMKPFLLGHLLMLSLGRYDKETILSQIETNDVTSIRFVDGRGLRAADYFDLPYNEWRTAGIAKALDNAYALCRG